MVKGRTRQLQLRDRDAKYHALVFCLSYMLSFYTGRCSPPPTPRQRQGCFILLRESKKGGSSGAQQLFTSYFYKQTVPPERKYSLFDGLSKTLQSSRLFVAINEDIIALRGSRLKVNLQRMKQPCRQRGTLLLFSSLRLKKEGKAIEKMCPNSSCR
jgi:hypothetical protein